MVAFVGSASVPLLYDDAYLTYRPWLSSLAHIAGAPDADNAPQLGDFSETNPELPSDIFVTAIAVPGGGYDRNFSPQFNEFLRNIA
jgi:hypothetical protein